MFAFSPAQAQAVELEEDEKHGESWAAACAPGCALCALKGPGDVSLVCRGLPRGLSSSKEDAVGTDASLVVWFILGTMEAAGGGGRTWRSGVGSCGDDVPSYPHG